TATLHKSLNISKGVIYSNELRNIDEKVIVEELKTQKVVEVKKILKKQNEILVETGLIIISFETLTIPEKIMIGYEAVRVRNYIPLPLQCKKCCRFGHPTTVCKSDYICSNCSNKSHCEENEVCTQIKNCINCKDNPEYNSNHNARDKNCPVFKKQQEITAIKTTEKVDHKTALGLYFSRHISEKPTTYAKMLTTSQSPNILPKTQSSTTSTAQINYKNATSLQQASNPVTYRYLLDDLMDIHSADDTNEASSNTTLEIENRMKDKSSTPKTYLKANNINLTKQKNNKQT
ncbi:uncharacterized protein LOC119665135, partial [Teleopsis dalmanni]|uniref:uncharacterized protein LOC119665135 n=1 Tax=Teleopsis dalmanni TaxID=139649 RepID=UPI0018CFE65D